MRPGRSAVSRRHSWKVGRSPRLASVCRMVDFSPWTGVLFVCWGTPMSDSTKPTSASGGEAERAQAGAQEPGPAARAQKPVASPGDGDGQPAGPAVRGRVPAASPGDGDGQPAGPAMRGRVPAASPGDGDGQPAGPAVQGREPAASPGDGDGQPAGPAVQGREPAASAGDGDGQPAATEQTAPPEARESSTAFPVVGVGASAGGLEALETLFSRIPRTGMAFVVIQHLAPSKESHLPEILARSTRLPVTQATDALTVEPDHIYVIPPGVNLAMFQGKLHLMEVPTAPAGEPLLPVDFFFQSLARDCGARCMGVVLSGTGLDGMRGLQEIRETGGLTFAQDPATARFQGMPSAAAVGADSVLPPEAIADELVRISRHPYVSRGSVSPQGEEGLKKLFLLIRSAFGTDLSFYKFATVQRRIERRMALNKIERLEDYVRLVQAHPGELKTLYRDLLINVTNFFRDGEPFEILRDVVFPRIIERKKPGDTLRVWVPGCSTGEEAYSVG